MEKCVKEEGRGCRRRWCWGGGSSMCHPHILAALLLINFSHDHSRSQYIKHEGLGGWVSIHLHPSCHLTLHYLLCGNANSFINLFTSPLVATALCFWWRTANNVSFSNLDLTALGGWWVALHLPRHPSFLDVSLSFRGELIYLPIRTRKKSTFYPISSHTDRIKQLWTTWII